MTARVVHLGLGAFFRAHGAVYLRDLRDYEGADWGVLGVSLRSAAVRNSLKPRNWRYHLMELGPEGRKVEDIDILTNVLVAPEDPEAVLDALSDPQVTLVTLTVTEKGYCLTGANGSFDLTHPDVAYDLSHPLPRSAPGFVTRALQRRWQSGLPSFSVLSLDNLPSNGTALQTAVLDMAQALDPALAHWISQTTSFPASMVDRIVPATSTKDHAAFAAQTGQEDAGLVVHEPFRQWVIEDAFAPQARPALNRVGAQMVPDITPYEHMKLRMLNGTHSAMAYLGALAGFRTVAEASSTPTLQAFLTHLWQSEIIPTLIAPDGMDLRQYATDLLTRYRNSGIQHLLEQIAMDGSQKLPQRLIAPLNETIAAGRSAPGLALAIAAWGRYLGGVDDHGQPLAVSDPLVAKGAYTPEDLLRLPSVFGPAPPCAKAVSNARAWLDTLGAEAAMQELLK